MKIVNKISLLLLFLLTALVVNTLIGITQIARIGFELKDVAQKDIALTDIISTLSQDQLQMNLLFERMTYAAEELTSPELPSARKKYLIDYVQLNKKGIDKISADGAMAIVKGKEIIGEGKAGANSLPSIKEYEQAEAVLRQIERAHIDYGLLVEDIFRMIAQGDYTPSLEDLNRIQTKEKKIAKVAKALLAEIKQFTQQSLKKARREESAARRILWASLGVSIFIGLLVTYLIAKSIIQPLDRLERAALQVGEGDFKVDLDANLKDEIGEVSNAFNIMAKKLGEAQAQLLKVNQELTENLKITNSQKRDLEKVNKELDKFVHTVSHDIKSPLMGVISYGSILADQYKDQLDDRAKKCIDGIQKGGWRITTMIQDLLTLTKLTRIRNPFEKCDIGAMIDAVIDRLEYKVKESNVELVIARGFPSLVCDRIKLTEAFYNLISNAIKFSAKRGQGRPKVEVGFHQSKDEYVFFVKDNGIGIAPEHHAEIFEIFKRLEEAQEYEGTGAGLCIVKEVIEDHHGKIWLESQVGRGSTFYFSVPDNLENS